MNRKILIALCAIAALSTARGDQLSFLEERDARAAARALRATRVYVDWISHYEDERPGVYAIDDVTVVLHEDHARVEARRRLLATGRRNGSVWRFEVRPGSCRAERAEIDLAYAYVPSAEIDGMFVNLGKKLGLECDVASIAIEVPRDAIARIASATQR